MSALPKPKLGEPYLLTPGPLTTSYAVKQTMLRDWGSWDSDFREITSEFRQSLLAMIHDTENLFDCVPMQGSGTFCVEAMLGAFVLCDGKVLVLSNGAYGKRIAQTLAVINRDYVEIDKGDYLPPRGEEVFNALRDDPDISHVVVVHCETSSGIVNPIAEISEAVYAQGRELLIDSMSAFGALPLEANEIRFQALASSANKCIEGVPGFGFIIARKDALAAAKGRSHSLSLDVHAQWKYMNTTGQWRFTPPTHTVVAFREALKAHSAEGGVSGRGARYTKNRDVLVAGMQALGFETLLNDRWLSPVIVTFFCPDDPHFEFSAFYDILKSKGFIIYPGKLTVADSFRIGCIGQMDHRVMKNVVIAIKETLTEMGVKTAAPCAAALKEKTILTVDKETTL